MDSKQLNDVRGVAIEVGQQVLFIHECEDELVNGTVVAADHFSGKAQVMYKGESSNSMCLSWKTYKALVVVPQ